MEQFINVFNLNKIFTYLLLRITCPSLFLKVIWPTNNLGYMVYHQW